jgi:glycosyltransferase involved in cell wall biosynthesis
MRILMTADAVGGVWTYARDLADALDADVVIATMGPPPPEAPEDVVVSTYALEWEDDPWEDVDRAGIWLLELEDELRPDVVHLNGYAHGALPWRAPVLVAAHSDVCSGWAAVHGEPAPPRYDRYRAAVTAGLRAADVLVAPTVAVLADLGRNFRLPRRSAVVPNGSSLTPASCDKEPFVAALGRFHDQAKNLEAIERARGSCPWPIVTAGAGSTLGRLGRDGVRTLLARASIFASPVRYEPFGLGILEAARSGCALVLGDVPSLRELWERAALFVAPWDDEALAAALRLLAEDDELRTDLATRARQRAARYTVERMAAGYTAVYEELCARSVAA